MSDIIGPDTARDSAFESPVVRQFTVFLDNRVGRLQALLRLLGEAKDRIAGFSIEESAECALVRLVCEKPDAGEESLRSHGFPVSHADVIAVRLPEGDRQPLVSVCAALLSAEINIHYAYPLLSRPAVVLSVDDPQFAATVLLRKGFKVLGESDLLEN